MRWLEVKVTVAAEAVEAVGERLLSLGARGFWTVDAGSDRALVSYFPCLDEGGGGPGGPGRPDGSSGPVDVLSVFLARLREWGLDPGPAEVTTRMADEAEWREQWKAFLHPVRVGRRLIIHPPWEKPAGHRPGVEAVERRIGDLSVVIDPGQAFGAGDHATTRGVVELVEATLDAREGQGRVSSAADLGTGSGILAIVAAKLGVERVVAVDNDPVATVAARANVAANGLAGRIEVVDGDLVDFLATLGGGVTSGQGRLGQDERPDLIMANLTTDLIASTLSMMATALRPGGVIVAAGVSSGEGEDRVMEVARSVGLAEIDRRSAENWVSFAFTKAPGRSHPGDRAPCGLARGDPAAPGLAGHDGTARGRPRAVFYTLGCKANLYDTAGMMDQLRQDGWEIVVGQEERPDGEAHDLYVVNSCAVTARAESKTGQLVRRLRREHPGVLVALVGCYPEVQRADLRRRRKKGAAGGEGAAGGAAEKEGALCGADLVLGTSDRHLLPQLLRQRGFESGPPVERRSGAEPVPLDLVAGAFAGERTRATLKVQDGCEQFCAYCVIPYARGPSRSRPAGEVLEEASRLVQAGFREIVVTGIHLGVWGSDLPAGRPRLTDLIRDLAAVTGIGRLRLSSIEPLEVDDALIDLLARNPRVCRHLHVPLQSGSDRVLVRMNRHYTAADYLDLVERVRSAVPLVGLTTDVMVGFPGETDEDFRGTLDVVRRARFSRLHVFRFSRRPGTPAADMPDQVASAVKKARSEELIRLGRQLGRDFRESLVGLTLEVLVEKVRRSGPRCLADGTDLRAGGRTGLVAEGLTDNYARVVVRAVAGARGPAGACGLEPNDLVKVFLEKATSEGLVGRPEPPTPARSSPAGGR